MLLAIQAVPLIFVGTVVADRTDNPVMAVMFAVDQLGLTNSRSLSNGVLSCVSAALLRCLACGYSACHVVPASCRSLMIQFIIEVRFGL